MIGRISWQLDRIYGLFDRRRRVLLATFAADLFGQFAGIQRLSTLVRSPLTIFVFRWCGKLVRIQSLIHAFIRRRRLLLVVIAEGGVSHDYLPFLIRNKSGISSRISKTLLRDCLWISHICDLIQSRILYVELCVSSTYHSLNVAFVSAEYGDRV